MNWTFRKLWLSKNIILSMNWIVWLILYKSSGLRFKFTKMVLFWVTAVSLSEFKNSTIVQIVLMKKSNTKKKINWKEFSKGLASLITKIRWQIGSLTKTTLHALLRGANCHMANYVCFLCYESQFLFSKSAALWSCVRRPGP